jgi:hypothetical protein
MKIRFLDFEVVGALKAGNLLSAEADAELSPGHAREP